jgi:hypothetical protein
LFPTVVQRHTMQSKRRFGKSIRLLSGLAVALCACRAKDAQPGSALVCTPYATEECLGPGACRGGQQCKDDGSAWGVCDCGQGSVDHGIAQFAGSSTDPINPQLPDIAFPPPEPASFEFSDDGFALSRTDLVLSFNDTTTLDEANALLDQYGARVVGSVPAGALLLLRLPDAPDPVPVVMAWLELQQDPRVDGVMVNDAFMALERLPPHNEQGTLNAPGPWFWTSAAAANNSQPTAQKPGSWGLQVARFPQVWNLLDWIQRDGSKVTLGVLDAGFSAQLDLGLLSSLTRSASDHGTGVAGVIAAVWDNRSVAEGAFSFVASRSSVPTLLYGDAALVNSGQSPEWMFLPNQLGAVLEAPVGGGTTNGLSNIVTGHNLEHLVRMVADHKYSIRAINNSYGASDFLSHVQDPKHPGVLCQDPTTIRIKAIDNALRAPRTGASTTYIWSTHIDMWGNFFYKVLQAADPEGKVVFVASAGNANWNNCPNPYLAKHNSPIANVAERYGGRYLSVMATAQAGGPYVTSDTGGSLAAPGECIRTTEDPDGTNMDFDVAKCQFADMGASYADTLAATWSGTSLAAPYVTAAVGILTTVDSSLSGSRITAILRSTKSSLWGLDAFAAVMTAAPDLVKALVDVDDGTLDGNQRALLGRDGAILYDDFGHDTKYVSGGNAAVPRGDGKINMADFRAFRDALLLIDAKGDLNGTKDHSKRDLNQNGLVETPDLENRYPRFDFNGDGVLSRTILPKDRGYEKPDNLKEKTDLAVLQSVWPGASPDTEFVGKDQLDALVDSGDLEVHADDLFAQGAISVKVTVTTGIVNPRTIDSTNLCVPGSMPGGPLCIIVTTPAGTGKVTGEPLDSNGQALQDDDGKPMTIPSVPFTLVAGQDIRVDLSACSDGKVWNRSTRKCECPLETPVWDTSSSRCVPCPPGKPNWNAVSQTCDAKAGCTGPLALADSNLDAAVRAAIAKPTGNIMPSDVANLTKLDLSAQAVQSLTGLECLTALTDLDLSAPNCTGQKTFDLVPCDRWPI